MKKSKSLLIQLPKPCSEDWAKMTKQERGRFCASCEKMVVDFTKMSDDELISFFVKDKGKTCGRFANHQLNRTLTPTETQRSLPISGIALAGALTVLTAGSGFAQTGDTLTLEQEPTHITVGEPIHVPMHDVTIRGRVMHDGLGVSQAKIIANDGSEVLTDHDGYFEAVVSKMLDEPMRLEVSHPEYSNQQLEFEEAIEPLEIELTSLEVIEPIQTIAKPAMNHHLGGVPHISIQPIPEKKKWWQRSKRNH